MQSFKELYKKHFGISRALRWGALILLASYRGFFAYLGFGGSCRFDPSCSAYAEQAFQQYPLKEAFVLSLKRISKCHPWGPFGFDPVPERSQKGVHEQQ